MKLWCIGFLGGSSNATKGIDLNARQPVQLCTVNGLLVMCQYVLNIVLKWASAHLYSCLLFHEWALASIVVSQHPILRMGLYIYKNIFSHNSPSERIIPV